MKTKNIVWGLWAATMCLSLYGERIEITNKSGKTVKVSIYYQSGAGAKQNWWTIKDEETFKWNEEGGSGYEKLMVLFRPEAPNWIGEPTPWIPREGSYKADFVKSGTYRHPRLGIIQEGAFQQTSKS